VVSSSLLVQNPGMASALKDKSPFKDAEARKADVSSQKSLGKLYPA
jgi:hypothetical protein